MLPLGAITEEQYEDTFGRNVKGLIFTVQKALPQLHDGASVILMGSTACDGHGWLQHPRARMPRSLRSSLQLRARLRTAALETPREDSWPSRPAGPEAAQQQGLLNYMATQVPIGRVADPDEIAKAVPFLVSDDAGFVAGAELFVDGGKAQV